MGDWGKSVGEFMQQNKGWLMPLAAGAGGALSTPSAAGAGPIIGQGLVGAASTFQEMERQRLLAEAKARQQQILEEYHKMQFELGKRRSEDYEERTKQMGEKLPTEEERKAKLEEERARTDYYKKGGGRVSPEEKDDAELRRSQTVGENMMATAADGLQTGKLTPEQAAAYQDVARQLLSGMPVSKIKWPAAAKGGDRESRGIELMEKSYAHRPPSMIDVPRDQWVKSTDGKIAARAAAKVSGKTEQEMQRLWSKGGGQPLTPDVVAEYYQRAVAAGATGDDIPKRARKMAEDDGYVVEAGAAAPQPVAPTPLTRVPPTPAAQPPPAPARPVLEGASPLPLGTPGPGAQLPPPPPIAAPPMPVPSPRPVPPYVEAQRRAQAAKRKVIESLRSQAAP